MPAACALGSENDSCTSPFELKTRATFWHELIPQTVKVLGEFFLKRLIFINCVCLW